jgi:hypothetical protein
LTAVKVIGRYLHLMIWPARLSCDYSFNEVPLSGWGDVGVLVALAVCAGTVALAACWRRKEPLLFFLSRSSSWHCCRRRTCW